jgi:hypothetical protein
MSKRRLAVVVMASTMLGCSLRNETTVYRMMCEVPVVQGRCPGKVLFPLNRTKIAVFPETQRVVRWFPGFEPDRLTDCAVADVENWTCRFANRAGEVSMVDGHYEETPEDPRVFSVGPVAWWRRSVFGEASSPQTSASR